MTQPLHLPSFAMGTPRKSNLDISRHNRGYTGLRSLAGQTWTNNILKPGTHCPPSSMCNHWKCSTWLWSTQNWHPFYLIRGSDGDVPCQGPCLYHHAHRKMVKQRFLCYIRKQVKQFSKLVVNRCSRFDLSEWSQTSHLVWSLTATPGNATIETMPRWDTILDVTSPDGCSYQRSLLSTDRLRMQKQLM